MIKRTVSGAIAEAPAAAQLQRWEARDQYGNQIDRVFRAADAGAAAEQAVELLLQRGEPIEGNNFIGGDTFVDVRTWTGSWSRVFVNVYVSTEADVSASHIEALE